LEEDVELPARRHRPLGYRVMTWEIRDQHEIEETGEPMAQLVFGFDKLRRSATAALPRY
jgi:hypothetical protein